MENSFPDGAIGRGSARRDGNEAGLISSAASLRVRSTELMSLALMILIVRRRGLLSPHNLVPSPQTSRLRNAARKPALRTQRRTQLGRYGLKRAGDPCSHCLHASDGGKSNQGSDKGIFDQILTGFVSLQVFKKFHHDKTSNPRGWVTTFHAIGRYTKYLKRRPGGTSRGRNDFMVRRGRI
jgi:hypothetical protein